MIRPRSPASLIITDFSDERCRFEYYWPRLNDSNIPTPKTLQIPLKDQSWDTPAIQDWMDENEYTRAFVRSQHKSATRRFRDGSFISDTSAETIDRTISSLLDQHIADSWPTGGSLVVREWLDLDFCRHPSHATCHPELRYFIEDGRVLGEYPTPTTESTFVCDGHYDYLSPLLSEMEYDTPRMLAERVAALIPEDTWAVDFVMDTSGQWYCIELNLNAVRWVDEKGDWMNMTGHGALEPWSPREVHSAALHHLRRPTPE